jgi:hypothetical protein
VHARWLPYAQVESQHAVVVVECASDTVTVLDPAAPASESVAVSLDAWLAAWTEMDCAYALIEK